MSRRRPLRALLAFLRELTGDAGYDRYRARHPHAVPTRREYEAMRCRLLEQQPVDRCC